MSYALVTGASSGIGAKLVAHLLATDWNVILVARSVDKMQEIVRNYPQSSSCILKCDVTDSNQVKQACSKAIKYCNNKLQLLVNNAGAVLSLKDTIDKCTEQDWDNTMNLNLRSAFLFTKYLKNSLMSSGDKASIINIGSIAGVTASPRFLPYRIAKAGLRHLTRCNALELAPYGIRCNCIDLAVVKTNAHKNAGFSAAQVDWLYKYGGSLHPIGKIGYPQDVVNMIMFLADVRLSGWITGQCIMMDGGRSLISAIPSQDKLKSKL